MAIHRCKGIALQESIAGVYTPIAQIISMDLPEAENETFEADYLDNTSAGIPYIATGRTEGGSLSGELFLDPALASHIKFGDHLNNPVSTGINYKVVFATTTLSWTMNVAGVSLGGTAALNDGLKGNFSLKINGIVAYTTTT